MGTTAAEAGANCCKKCEKEDAKYGFIQHFSGSKGGAWTYDNAAANYTGPDNGAATGAESDPTKPNQPTSRPAGNDPPGKVPESMYKPGGGINRNFPGERWKDNPWYAGTGNPSGNIGNPSPSTDIADSPGGGNFITQLVCVEGGKVLWKHEWTGPKAPPPPPKK